MSELSSSIFEALSDKRFIIKTSTRHSSISFRNELHTIQCLKRVMTQEHARSEIEDQRCIKRTRSDTCYDEASNTRRQTNGIKSIVGRFVTPCMCGYRDQEDPNFVSCMLFERYGKDLLLKFTEEWVPAYESGSMGEVLPSKLMMTYACQCLEGLHWLHQWGFLHGDVKPENILCGEEGCKWADFGGSSYLGSHDPDLVYRSGGHFKTYSRDYLAPELDPNLMNLWQRYTGYADMWSLGTTLFQVFCRFNTAPEGLVDIVQEMRREDVHQRPRAGDAYCRLERMRRELVENLVTPHSEFSTPSLERSFTSPTAQ